VDSQGVRVDSKGVRVDSQGVRVDSIQNRSALVYSTVCPPAPSEKEGLSKGSEARIYLLRCAWVSEPLLLSPSCRKGRVWWE
jgi:hypothetical protein